VMPLQKSSATIDVEVEGVLPALHIVVALILACVGVLAVFAALAGSEVVKRL
jgi:hypothetical protein